MSLWEEIWVYHSPSDCCCVTHRCDLSRDDLIEIGPALDCSTIECKRLLLELGWKRERIQKTGICPSEAKKKMKQFKCIESKTQTYGPHREGIAAMFRFTPKDQGLLDEAAEIIFMAPDWESLRQAWATISQHECVQDRCAMVIQSAIDVIDYSATEPLPPKENKPLYGAGSLIWVYDVEEDKIFVDSRGSFECWKSLKELQEIGPALLFSTIECKQLLLKLGWSREDIREVTIIDGYDDIPF